MKKTTPLVAMLLDASGSMQKYKDETITGVNSYLQELSGHDPKMEFALVTFDSTVTTRWPLKTVKAADRLDDRNYHCGAMTPLYDACMSAISYADELRKKDQPVIFVIVTDGEENASRRYDVTDLKRTITAQQEDGWTFVYMGANQDAWLIGEHLGVRHGAIQTFTQRETVSLFTGLSVATICLANNPEQTADEFWDSTDATKFGGKNRMTP